jgi:hypothetical protein
MARTNEGLRNKIEREVRREVENRITRRNRTPAEMWELRMLERGVVTTGKIYVWKPTVSQEFGRRSEKKFTQCVFALICANVLFVVFLFWIVNELAGAAR